MQPKRILHVVSAMHRGGVETMIMNFYRNIDREKIQFDFIVHGDKIGEFEEEISSLGGRIYHVTPKHDSFIKNQKEVHSVIKRNKYNIVHVHQDAMSMFPLRLAKKSGVKFRIAHAHSTSMPPSLLGNIIYKYAIKNLKKYANVYCSCSKASADYLFNRDDKEVIYLYNGIDINKYRFSEEKRRTMRNENNWENCFLLGHIGNFMYPKNHEFVIDIYKSFLLKNPNSKLILCGSGELMNSIKSKVSELKLENNVVFMGNVSNIDSVLSAIDCLILPSKYEGFPVVTVEAQCSDTPILVSDNITKETKITEAIEYVSLSNSPEIWADKIVKKCENYKRKDRTSLLVQAGFDIKETTYKLQEMYLNMN